MKRFLTAIITILFLLSTTGTTVHLHYCMGKLVGASHHAPKPKHKCTRCGMIVDIQKYKGCCKDESKTYKSSEQQKTLDIDLFTCIKTLVAEPLFYLSNVKNIVSVQASKQLFLAHAPPERLEHCPHFIFFRNIRI